jgi:hypothetical protein
MAFRRSPDSWTVRRSQSRQGTGGWGIAAGYRRRPISFILELAVTKRKPSRFSAAKAVKANARERVGQPKPARVIEPKPQTGRGAKHKSKLEDLIEKEQ